MKGIRFDIPDDLHQELKIKLAKEGRQSKELFLTLTRLYVSEGNEKNRSKKSSRKS
ncbi:hypothetical protein ES702_07675 [subsurface metagenome]